MLGRLKVMIGNWFRQPTTIVGLMCILKAVVAVIGGQSTWAAQYQFILAGLVGIIFNDHTAKYNQVLHAVSSFLSLVQSTQSTNQPQDLTLPQFTGQMQPANLANHASGQNALVTPSNSSSANIQGDINKAATDVQSVAAIAEEAAQVAGMLNRLR